MSSDDSRATVEQYVKWVSVLRRKGSQVDGFVLTEHRQFDGDKDYSGLSEDNDVVILKGSELDTNYGHFLVYGVTQELLNEIDFTRVGLDAIELMRAADAHGAIAIPAHPGRFGIGLVEYIDNGSDFSGVKAVEHLNGSNRPGEQERAEGLISQRGYASTGGSDAHVVSAIGTCMTSFEGVITNEADLVRELLSKNFKAVHLNEAKA
ncbi:MAG: hypothetical protein O2821_13475 [Chloroflexi bacterium]|nr:hypothetical protein [Chloroflexota bacterium]MDA1229007.1 hypothetical protein [Chloroflexota bacterium]